MDSDRLKAMYTKQVNEHGLDTLDDQLKSMCYQGVESWSHRIDRFGLVCPNSPVKGDYRFRTMLDVGCGTGRAGMALMNQLFEHQKQLVNGYLGIDLVDEFIAHAQRKYKEHPGTFLCGDFLDDEMQAMLDQYGNFHLTVAIGTFAWADSTNIMSTVASMWAHTSKAMVFDLLKSHYTANEILTVFINPLRPHTWVLREEANTFTVYLYKAPIDTAND